MLPTLSISRLVPLVFGLMAWASCAVPAQARQEGSGTREDPLQIDVPDSLVWAGSDSMAAVAFPVQHVRASRVSRVVDGRTTRLGRSDLARADALSLAGLGPALPATRVGVNSRGEALFMIRGASERHVHIRLDGIPLGVPWDERADLSMIPLLAIGEVEAERGVHSALDAPNALAGVVELTPRQLDRTGAGGELRLSFGEAGTVRAEAVHLGRSQTWSWLAAAGWRERDGFLVPADLEAGLHQPDRRLRTNSQLEQGTILLRGTRSAGGGRAAVLFQASDGSKGVPPEMHRPDARFWRYPRIRRGLLGLSYDRPAAAGGWDVEAAVSLDAFRQEIRAFDDATYSSPELAPGVDYEDGRDRTVQGRLRLGRDIGTAAGLGLATTVRATRHRERLVVEGPEESYAQILTSLAAEWDHDLGEVWRVEAGAGYEIATTPETGDKPSRDSTADPVLRLGLARAFGQRGRMHASFARRSRFPSLREMFSGALGRFVPNPDLRAERQDQVEIGGAYRAPHLEAAAAAFAGWLDGAIERVPREDRQFERVNLDVIRSLGLEMGAAWRPGSGLTVRAHHSLLHARARGGDAYDRRVEDRPAHLTSVSVDWIHRRGLGMRIEGFVIGPRYSADVNDPVDGLTRLPAQASWNARASYRHFPGGRLASAIELFVRVDNVLDQRTDSQIGLPDPGRMTTGGLRITFGED